MEILSTEEEEILEKNLVWIFADRRSGTTWLMELLSYNTKNMDEPLIGLHMGKFCFTPNNTISRTFEVQCGRQDYFFSNAYKEVWNYFLRKLILNRIHSQFHDLTKKIVIKEPTGSITTDILTECLPNSRMIVVIRDPRDVIDSKVDEVMFDSWEMKNKNEIIPPLIEKNRLARIEKSAILWVGLTEILMKAYQKHPENLRWLVHYEDLLANTVQELRKLYQFLQIDIADENLNSIVEKFSFKNIPEEEKGRGKFRRFASPGKWKENFNDQEKQIMNNLLKDMMRKVGYEV